MNVRAINAELLATASLGLALGVRLAGWPLVRVVVPPPASAAAVVSPAVSPLAPDSLVRLIVARDPFRGNLPGINNANLLALNYGIGIKARTSGWLGFRADVRGFLEHAPAFGLPRESSDPNATVFPVTGALHNGEASVGVVFYFFNRR